MTDADRAEEFYMSLGWREDGDLRIGDDYRVVQFTPTGSQASIIFGAGVTAAVPRSGGSLVLAVSDIDAARADLVARGVEVSAVLHDAAGGVIAGLRAGTDGRAPGRDPECRSCASYATFSDPDGNAFLLQELTTRFPGRTDIPAIAELLHETASTMTRTRGAARRTTGGTGTRRTSTRARAAAPRTRPRPSRGATWRRRGSLLPDDVRRLRALSHLVSRSLRRRRRTHR